MAGDVALRRASSVVLAGVAAACRARARVAPSRACSAPAHADPQPPASSSCNPAIDTDYDVTAQVTPVVTDFLAVNITSGTTGQRTESLTQVDSVSTSTSSTMSTAVTNAWSFNQPGYYELYRGTRRVDGQYVKYVCAQTGSTTGIWVNAVKGGVGTYTTYENPEIGTVVRNCVPEPAGTVRRVAQDRLGMC